MSLTVRKQLFSILDLLDQACALFRKDYRNQSVAEDEFMQLMMDCQNSAIQIGDKIEKVYGMNTKSVKGLEEYCELLYQLSQNLDFPQNAIEVIIKIEEKLNQIRSDMEEELPNKKEVVFFPYKASMWDSLESVYLKAKDDPESEAFCVPIPYYERNADGSFGEMHYEGDQYPKNIEITDWQSYDLAEKMPDVAYIHNPYDGCNYVTSIHPSFYADELKKYVQELVYIPYFVLDEIDPSDQEAIDGMKHFCFLPGTIYADKVILQSENMRQIYINEFEKEAIDSGLRVTREELEKKFLGTGSPKFDKVQRTQREDLEIPEDWLKIIKKPDGTFKKIVFYNTSITAFLADEKAMLAKIEDVFQTFYENRENVALLWRPHPLLLSTAKAMRPDMAERFDRITKKYQEEGWGIFDDSSDMDRAVILSDAYYGDQSSVVQVYQKTGKPIMIQNVEIIKMENE